MHSMHESGSFTKRNNDIRPIISSFPRERLLVDAIDLRRYAGSNNGHAWIFTFVDSFTKFGWDFPSVHKSGSVFAGIIRKFL